MNRNAFYNRPATDLRCVDDMLPRLDGPWSAALLMIPVSRVQLYWPVL